MLDSVFMDKSFPKIKDRYPQLEGSGRCHSIEDVIADEEWSQGVWTGTWNIRSAKNKEESMYRCYS